MDRFTSVTLAAALVALAPGCIHVHTDGAGKVKSIDVKTGAEPAAADGGVKQASATVPAAAVPAAAGGLSKLVAKMPTIGGPGPAVTIFTTWQNRIAQLPDPTAEGKFKPGLVGQMFLFGTGPKMAFCPPNGKLTVELFDATPRADTAEPVRLGSWTFEKDVLAKLITTDERFGKCYALFLPWPSYTPAVTRVRLMAKYEPEHGYVLHAEPMTMSIDTTTGPEGPQVQRSSSTVLPGAGPIVMSAAPGGAAPPPGPAIPFYRPTAPASPAAAGPPSGLPPLTITMPGR